MSVLNVQAAPLCPSRECAQTMAADPCDKLPRTVLAACAHNLSGPVTWPGQATRTFLQLCRLCLACHSLLHQQAAAERQPSRRRPAAAGCPTEAEPRPAGEAASTVSSAGTAIRMRKLTWTGWMGPPLPRNLLRTYAAQVAPPAWRRRSAGL